MRNATVAMGSKITQVLMGRIAPTKAAQLASR
jgi:hypothetical protein